MQIRLRLAVFGMCRYIEAALYIGIERKNTKTLLMKNLLVTWCI
jgi:hypothetical protein